MSRNIEAMLEELKEKYPEHWGDPIRGLEVNFYDATNDEYGIDDDFTEEFIRHEHPSIEKTCHTVSASI